MPAARSSWKPTPPKSQPPAARRIGDPGNGRSRTISYRLDPQHIALVDEMAQRNGGTRPDELRAAVAAVLADPPAAGVIPGGRADARSFTPVTWPPAAGQRAALHALAEELGVSVVAVVRWAVGRHVEQAPPIAPQ